MITKTNDQIEDFEEFKEKYFKEVARRARMQVQERALLQLVRNKEAHLHTSKVDLATNRKGETCYGFFTFWKLETDLTPEEFAFKMKLKGTIKCEDEPGKRKLLPQIEIHTGF